MRPHGQGCRLPVIRMGLGTWHTLPPLASLSGRHEIGSRTEQKEFSVWLLNTEGSEFTGGHIRDDFVSPLRHGI